jgi:hypothetical protein
MTVESGFPLTLNFATLYVGKIESLHFQQMKNCICKIFMNFLKILKLLWIFKVIVKKIHINYKVYSQTSIFLIVCVNHNRQYNDGWKSSMPLKQVKHNLENVVFNESELNNVMNYVQLILFVPLKIVVVLFHFYNFGSWLTHLLAIAVELSTSYLPFT